jgi:hypothetical protein
MSKLKTVNPIIESAEDHQEFDIVPRRRIERRSSARRSYSNPKILGPDYIAQLRKYDIKPHLILREGDRRKQNRRNSRPSLLRADEIVILRKK